MHLTKILLITSLALFSTSVALPVAVKENELAARSEDGFGQLFRRAPQAGDPGVTFTDKLKTTVKKVQNAAKNAGAKLSKKSDQWQELPGGSPSPDPEPTSTKPGGDLSSGRPVSKTSSTIAVFGGN